MISTTVSRTVASNVETELEVRKSRFICNVFRVSNETEARTALGAVHDRHWDANHHCSAWRIGESGQLQRSNDDGEPAGSAGAPILEALLHRDLTDTLAVVTRRFGGTKLGVGGLVRAYGASVSMAIDRAGIVERRPLRVIEVVIGHDEAGRIEHALRASGIALAEVTYNPEGVTFAVHLEAERVAWFSDWVADASAGRGRTQATGIVMIEVPVALGQSKPGSPSSNQGARR